MFFHLLFHTSVNLMSELFVLFFCLCCFCFCFCFFYFLFCSLLLHSFICAVTNTVRLWLRCVRFCFGLFYFCFFCLFCSVGVCFFLYLLLSYFFVCFFFVFVIFVLTFVLVFLSTTLGHSRALHGGRGSRMLVTACTKTPRRPNPYPYPYPYTLTLTLAHLLFRETRERGTGVR